MTFKFKAAVYKSLYLEHCTLYFRKLAPGRYQSLYFILLFSSDLCF